MQIVDISVIATLSQQSNTNAKKTNFKADPSRNTGQRRTYSRSGWGPSYRRTAQPLFEKSVLTACKCRRAYEHRLISYSRSQKTRKVSFVEGTVKSSEVVELLSCGEFCSKVYIASVGEEVIELLPINSMRSLDLAIIRYCILRHRLFASQGRGTENLAMMALMNNQLTNVSVIRTRLASSIVASCRSTNRNLPSNSIT